MFVKIHGYLTYFGIDSVVIFNILKLLQNWKVVGSKRNINKLITQEHHMINDCAANMEQFIVTAGCINFQFSVWKRRNMRGA